MAPTPSNSAIAALDSNDRRRLIAVAQAAIVAGLDGKRLPIDVEAYAPVLRAARACFVTLTIGDNLRGCVGTLDPRQPLVADVAENAHNAAFRDPRFMPLTHAELASIDIHISILAPPEPMQFTSEQDLLRQLRPGIDGLILNERHYHGTFLPDVWRVLPVPRDFMANLKQKAGLPPDYWSDAMRVSRYTTESIP